MSLLSRLRGPRLADVKLHGTAPGPKRWGGAADVMGQFVTPFMKRRGLAPGSKKRTPEHNAAIGGSPTSDHLTTRTTAFAVDFPTFSGEDDARALAKAIGFPGWQANSYATYTRRVGGRLYRFQILWGSAIGHGDHIHVGVSLV